ncbi:hypothetical protein BJ165DRAFT_1528904 [Panaeolus papilionaceus]|nr:hypothetical protein BJ165DRAFT_1528904 [Panaeolus papilionaceus]
MRFSLLAILATATVAFAAPIALELRTPPDWRREAEPEAGIYPPPWRREAEAQYHKPDWRREAEAEPQYHKPDW